MWKNALNRLRPHVLRAVEHPHGVLHYIYRSVRNPIVRISKDPNVIGITQGVGILTIFGFNVRGIFEMLGPSGLSMTISKTSNKLDKLETGYLYHYTFLILIGSFRTFDFL
jgi:hypothetical protein